jgi:3-hydroxyisobutyrate dehydrogenase-like beta-hydroxyacid dehydrogenase
VDGLEIAEAEEEDMGTTIETVAVMAPGDMGHAVAKVLVDNGMRVITCLTGRSERTRALAARAGAIDVADDRALVGEADLLLSILVPAQALDLAGRVARALDDAGGSLVYVDCNAIAPGTARQVGEIVEAAGARFVDAGIIGPPPRLGATSTRFYASGPHAGDFAALRDFGLDVRPIGERVGDASAMKMCYASMTKGTTALMVQLSLAAERLGVSAALRDEMALSQGAMAERMARAVPAMVPKAHRWVGEMEEIARTFDAAGLPPETFRGIAELYAMVAATPLGATSQEDWNQGALGYDQVVARLAADAARRR